MTNAVAEVALTAVTTSLPTLYPNTLLEKIKQNTVEDIDKAYSYFEKTLIVPRYKSNRLVVQAGESRSGPS